MAPTLPVTARIATGEQKAEAYSIFYSALIRGEVTRPKTCEKCHTKPKGKRRLHGHHEDYSAPLKIIWLCAGCHRKVHCLGIIIYNKLIKIPNDLHQALRIRAAKAGVTIQALVTALPRNGL